VSNPLKRLYNWVLSWAESPWGAWALFVLSFTESSFFPVPPDILLIALGLSVPAKSFRYAFICSLGSVLGGVFGYYIGWQFWQWVGYFFFDNFAAIGFTPDTFDKVRQLYDGNAFWAVFSAAFTFIPYKIFTIAGGVFKINFAVFLLASIVGRSLRFFVVAAIIRFGGAPAKQLIDRYFNLLTVIFIVLLVGGFLLVKLFLK
jgi:membrane protein YqaA with SNARE-associated domain